MRRTSLLPADVAGAVQKIAEALDRLQIRLVSRDLLVDLCTGADQPLRIEEVVAMLVERGYTVFYYSTEPGAYRKEVEAGRAANRNMLEAALAGKPWPPPAPLLQPLPEPVTMLGSAPPPPAPIPLDRDGHPRFDGGSSADRLESIRRAIEDRRGRQPTPGDRSGFFVTCLEESASRAL